MAEREQVQAGLCDICHRRPAAVRVTVMEDGQRRTLNVCRQDYARLRARQASPFESVFGGSLFGDDMMGDFFGDGDGDGSRGTPAGAGEGRSGRPRRRDREGVDVGELLSKQAEEALQQAARTAAEWGSNEVDSEHVLFALADNDVVQAILARLKLSPEDLKRQVKEASPKREKRQGDKQEIGVSPRVKGALLAAFNASRDMGHS